jgi:hypothetical protein
MVSHRIGEKDEQLTPAVALVLEPEAIDARLRPGTYVLAAALWSFQALQDTEKLAYAAAPLDASGKLLEPELAERLAVAAVASGQDWLEARNVVDLERAYRVANEVRLGHLAEEYEALSRALRARNEDRADVQLRTLEQHLRLQTSRLQETLQKRRDPNASVWRGRLPVILIGGGGQLPFFRSIVDDLDPWLKKHIGNEGAAFLPVAVPQTISGKTAEPHRLAVAWGLSHPDFNIGEITPADRIPDVEPPRQRDWQDGFVSKDQV